MSKKEKVFCKHCKYGEVMTYHNDIICRYTTKTKEFNYRVGTYYRYETHSTLMNNNGRCKFYEKKPKRRIVIEKILTFLGFRKDLDYTKEN